MSHQRKRCIRKVNAAIRELRKAKVGVQHCKDKCALKHIRHSLRDIGRGFRSLMKL